MYMEDRNQPAVMSGVIWAQACEVMKREVVSQF
jgi:hypothetical protein